MVKITTFNDRLVRHVRYMPDGSVILKLHERRRREKTPLHRIVSENLESWLACRYRAERPAPGHVAEELRGYLECGILCFGFARALCTGCG